MQTITVATDDRTQVLDVTDAVFGALPAGAAGTATAFVRHTTAALVVQEAESGLLADVETFLEDLVPGEGWDHDRIDDNADAHLRAALLGPSVTVPCEGGDLALGTWQSILLVECDGPRRRTLAVCGD